MTNRKLSLLFWSVFGGFAILMLYFNAVIFQRTANLDQTHYYIRQSLYNFEGHSFEIRTTFNISYHKFLFLNKVDYIKIRVSRYFLNQRPSEHGFDIKKLSSGRFFGRLYSESLSPSPNAPREWFVNADTSLADQWSVTPLTSGVQDVTLRIEDETEDPEPAARQSGWASLDDAPARETNRMAIPLQVEVLSPLGKLGKMGPAAFAALMQLAFAIKQIVQLTVSRRSKLRLEAS